MRIATLALLLLAGCTTTTQHLASSAPFEVVHSRLSRTAVADCLLNRLSSDEVIPTRDVAPSATTLSFNGLGMARHPAIYVFVIRDEQGGSSIEVHRYAKSTLAAAETCF